MQYIGYIGLGKMGRNMVLRLLEKKWQVVAYNRTPGPAQELEKDGAIATSSIVDLIVKLPAPRLVWLMVAHSAVDDVLGELIPLLEKGDTVIDGGNSPYKETLRRAKVMTAKGINYMDAGVSGGPKGAREGACVMVGGEKEIFETYEGLFRDISVTDGYKLMGKSGAGHFVKMVHNGIEYGMMQALAEGFAVMKAAEFSLDLKAVADIYDHRSVIESRLVGWLKDGYEKYGEELAEISGSARQLGEGMWTVEAAKELEIPVPIIEGAVKFRQESQNNPSYTGKILMLLRSMFGQHEIK